MISALGTDGRLVATGAVCAAAALLIVIGWLLARLRRDDRHSQFHLRRLVAYVIAAAAVVALVFVWHPGQAGIFLGLVAAGFAFAAQEVVGAVAGWFNVVSGHIYRVGDQIQVGGVQGEVIDVTLVRTKILEMCSESALTSPEPSGGEYPSWVRGRQYTGRIVTISNKATFTDPVFNYSATLDFLWEEVVVPVPYSADWNETERVSDSTGARAAIEAMARRYPVPITEVEPTVYVRLTDNWMELTARFVVPARTVKSDLSRRLRERFDEAGIVVASSTTDVTLHDRRP